MSGSLLLEAVFALAGRVYSVVGRTCVFPSACAPALMCFAGEVAGHVHNYIVIPSVRFY